MGGGSAPGVFVAVEVGELVEVVVEGGEHGLRYRDYSGGEVLVARLPGAAFAGGQGVATAFLYQGER